MDGWPAVSDDFWRQLLLLGNQCVHRFCVFIVFFQWFFALDFDNLYVWGTLCLKDFCCKTPNISRLVLPMTALLGGFLGVAIILSLRRSALKLVEIAKYQELQKQGDIQDAVSNLNVLQWLGSQTSGFSKEKGLQEGKGWGWNFSKTIFVGLNGRSPLVGGKNYYLPACLTTYPRWEWQLFSLIEVRCSSPKWNKIHIPILWRLEKLWECCAHLQPAGWLFRFPMCLLQREDFVEAGELLRHEDAREAGKLRFFDDPTEVADAGQQRPLSIGTPQTEI